MADKGNPVRKMEEYTCWDDMIGRCYRPAQPNYRNYGGRGISVCEQWRRSFRAFLAYMGLRPSRGHSLDRYPDNNGNYEPGNVRWATRDEQSRNKRTNRWITFGGKTLVLEDWATLLGLAPHSLSKRIKNHGLEFAMTAAKGVRRERAPRPPRNCPNCRCGIALKDSRWCRECRAEKMRAARATIKPKNTEYRQRLLRAWNTRGRLPVAAAI